jgi:3'(2'), 5'-bisphosphate nucleotidase
MIPNSAVIQLAAIAHAAGKSIMDIYQTDFAVFQKSDLSPVTSADQLAEHLILTQLSQYWPQIPVIAEEKTSRGEVPEIASRFFLVDPLDGTREFLARNGEFTVNIALIESGVPMLGVVYAPALSRMYCGDAGTGAFKTALAVDEMIANATWEAIRVAPHGTSGPVAIASRSHRDEKTEAYITKANARKIMNVGSSLKFCVIAEGNADIYPRFGRTMEWDTAAGQAVLEAAGGHVRDENGVRLVYGKSARGYDNPAFFATAS